MKSDPPKPRLAPTGTQRGSVAPPTGDDRGDVPSAAPKTRLAITAFAIAANLVKTVEELEDAGFSRDQIGIAGLERAIAALHADARDRNTGLLAALLRLTEKSKPGLIYSGTDFVLVACGPLWQSIGGLGANDGDRLVIASWMEPATRTEMTRQISNGAIMLVVRADTVDQQRRSARILLSHSSERVQTHEFIPN